MATLEKIRKRSGLLIIVIGLAMAAFILMDLMGSGGSLLRGDQDVVGEVGGNKIRISEFSNRVDELNEAYQQQQQPMQISNTQLVNAVWEEFIGQNTRGVQYEKLGMTITPDELYYQVTNHPSIRSHQAFVDENGQFSKARFDRTINMLIDQRNENEEMQREYRGWRRFERELEKEALKEKYNTAIEKGFYVPNFFARHNYMYEGATFNIKYVNYPYAQVADEDVEVSESDLKKYYNENKEKYKAKEPLRSIQYVNFPIVASVEDNEATKDELLALLDDRIEYNNDLGRNDTLPGFRNTESDSLFVTMNSQEPFDYNYYKKGALSNPILDSVMFEAEEGYIHGPYVENGQYRVSKLSNVKFLPDSVKARHILIAFQGAERAGSDVTRSPIEAKELADSLLKVIQDDPSMFDSVSQQYNNDMVARGKGGDLGWFGQGMMAQPFENFCFRNPKGTIGSVFTDFGFHIIEITDQKGSNKAVQVATISLEIIPSEKTNNLAYQHASDFANKARNADDYTQVAAEMNLELRPVNNLKPMDEMIPGLGNVRKIVRWAFEEKTKEGDIQMIDNDGNSLVVLFLTEKIEPGYKPLSSVEEEIRQAVIKEKKSEIIEKKLEEAMASNERLQEIGQAVGKAMNEYPINFSAPNIPGVGNEPRVAGAAAALEQGKIYGPVRGENGVFLIELTEATMPFDQGDYTDERTRAENMLKATVTSQIDKSLKNSSKVKDRRHIFY